MKLILGSQSPRRRELLAGLDIPFESITIDADESFPTTLQAADIPIYISRAKARAYEGTTDQQTLLLTSDTIVWCDGQMMGKPKDEDEARRMLRNLSGKTHQVYTGVTIKGEDMISFCDQTDVTFRELTDEEIDYYVRTYRPMDKAGAYGIQEWIGYIGVEKIVGSYFNVMGFPVEKVYLALKNYGF